MKKRVPHIRTQESFASGTASMHAAESVNVPVKVISLAAGITEKQISDLYHCGRRAQRRTPHMLHSTNGAVQVSVRIHPPVTSAPAIPPSAASSLRPVAVRMCHASLCASHRPVLQEDFISTSSRLLGLLSQAGAVSHFGCAVLPYCFVRVRIASARSAAKHVRDARCMAGRLIKSGAILQACGWIRPPAASSLPPASAPVFFSLQNRYGKSWWQGQLKGVVSRHLFVSRQEGKQPLVDYAIADSVSCRRPYRCAVSSSPGCFSMQVREWSCAAGLLIKPRAIVRVSGWIRPPFASARAIPPSAASSLRPVAAPVCLLQCSYGGCFRAVRSGHRFVARSATGRRRAKLFRDARCMAGRLIKSGAILQACGWIRPPVSSTPAIPPSVASSLRPVAAPVFFSLQNRCGKSWWQGQLKGVVSRHLFVSRQEGKQPLVDYAIADSVSCRRPYRCAVSSSPGCFSMQVREWSCAAGLLIKPRAIVRVSGWIRPPFASARAIPPSAASSLRPVAAPVCLLQCSYGGCFRAVRSGHRFVARSATGRRRAKLFRDARCMAGRLIKSGAILQACGWIRPPVSSTPAIPPSVASSLRPVAAPVFFSLQNRCGKSWWQGQLKGVVSRHLFVSRQEGKQPLVDYAIADSVSCRRPYRCAVSSSPGCFSMQVREWSCAAGLLIKPRAIVRVSGWIRPPFAAVRAIPPSAASSLRPVAAPVCLLQCSYGGCFRAVRSGHRFVARSATGRRRAKLFRDARCMAGRLIKSGAILQACGWIRPPVSSTPAIPPSVAASLRPVAAPVHHASPCASNCLSCKKTPGSLGFSVRQVQFPTLVASCCVVLPYCFVVRVRIASARSAAKHVRDARCMAGRLITNRAIIQASGWIRPPVTSAHAIPPSAASSLRRVAAPVHLASPCASQRPVLHEDFISTPSRLLRFPSQAGSVSHFDCTVLLCCSVVRVRIATARSPAKHVRDARCVAGRLITNRAIIQASGWIRPPVATAHAIPPSAASSLWPVAAPVHHASPCASNCLSCKKTPGSLGFSVRQVQFPTLVASCCVVLPYCFVVRVRIASARSAAKHVRDARCMAGRLITNRAIIQASGWIRPPFASARAIPPSAASSLRPVAAPVCLLQCSYGGCFRAVRSGHLFVLRSATGRRAKLFRDARCVAGRLITNSVVIQASGWIRPPVTSTPAIPPSAASSLRPVAVRMFHASMCASHRPVLQEDSRLLALLSQAGAVSHFGCSVLPYGFIVWVSIASARSATKHVRDARCMAGRLITNRAIIQASGWIRPPVTSAHAIPPSAASSLRRVAAPVHLASPCASNGLSCKKTPGFLGFSVRQVQFPTLVVPCCVVLPCCFVVRVRIALTRSAAKHVRDARCMANGAIIQACGWIRPPVATARAISPSAAASLRPVAAPVHHASPCASQRPVLHEDFISTPSRLLRFPSQAGSVSHFDCTVLLCCSVVRVRIATARSPAKHVRDARCVAGRLITNRAIIQASGWICPRSAHDQRKCRALEGSIGKRLVLVFSHHAHQSSSKQANHSARCIRLQDLVHGARMAFSKILRPVQAAPKRHAVLRSFGCGSRMWAPPSPKVGMPRPSSWPSAAFMLGVQGAARVARSDFRDVGFQAAVEANYVEIHPVEETLRSAQVPFVVMIRKLLPLLPSQALQGRQVLLDLVLAGHSHGGVIAHSMAQSLESAGFLVRGIVAVDTLGLPRKASLRFDPQALERHRSPYHWHLSSPKVNMMAPEVPRRMSRVAECVPASG